ncbi:MarR family transcriptional regulator [Bacillus luteolus]|uniref:MarR family transcriptional regulator n=1 Tax=Litchfieldia luteola TaxID=682179 RepID=A0ABR9QMA3_9BACI|nr:MarR family transcriptional regulator [Cytobacillus luteolus]MBE4909640.1 MarR family transcriptional regulator [Cytobacillus luteolus]MBP1941041.1 DNA-binding MarR family transcriptional regulator [Cytobacillus luteolus]
MEDYKYCLDHSLGYKLFHASRLMMNRLNQNFKEQGYPVTYEQWQILSRLYDEDGQTQNQLAILNERDQASVSRLIDNMIKRNLVKRVPHSEDKRINLIFLTEESKKIQGDLEGLAKKTIAEASNGMAEEDLNNCLEILDKIRKNLK